MQCDSIECLHMTSQSQEMGWQEWEGLCEAAENGYFCSSLVYDNAYCTVSRHMRALILTQDPSIAILPCIFIAVWLAMLTLFERV